MYKTFLDSTGEAVEVYLIENELLFEEEGSEARKSAAVCQVTRLLENHPESPRYGIHAPVNHLYYWTAMGLLDLVLTVEQLGAIAEWDP
jgi:hypothetical protein